jgi:translation initiation factor IF-1
MKETVVTMSGIVVGTNRGSATVELSNGSVIRGIIAGRLVQHRIKVMVGDGV